jgi:hypothetical protein
MCEAKCRGEEVASATHRQISGQLQLKYIHERQLLGDILLKPSCKNWLGDMQLWSHEDKRMARKRCPTDHTFKFSDQIV